MNFGCICQVDPFDNGILLQDFFEDVGPLLSMQLGSKALEGLFRVFNSYVDVLVRALPGSIEEEDPNFESSCNKIVQMAETEANQLALLANASLLADELLPRAAMKLSLDQTGQRTDDLRRPLDRQNRNPEQREWKRRLLSTVDKLKDAFCRQHALDLIFTEEGDSHLSADMYINIDENGEDVDFFPSLIFQVVVVSFPSVQLAFMKYCTQMCSHLGTLIGRLDTVELNPCLS